MKYVLTIFSVILLLLGVAGFAIARSGHVHLLSVQTDSMTPVLRHGDLVIVEKCPLGQLIIGDIVSYHSLIQPRLMITHRIVAVDQARHIIITRGDATAIDDAPISVTSVQGKAWSVIPRLGYFLNFLQSIPGLIVFSYLPALLVVLEEGRIYLEN